MSILLFNFCISLVLSLCYFKVFEVLQNETLYSFHKYYSMYLDVFIQIYK